MQINREDQTPLNHSAHNQSELWGLTPGWEVEGLTGADLKVHSWERGGEKRGRPTPVDTCHRRVGRVEMEENLEEDQKRPGLRLALAQRGGGECVKISLNQDLLAWPT